jgi:tripartite-type tricarboxylate transporter receptor subunit TctC
MTHSRRTFVASLGALAATPLVAQTPPAFPNKVIRIVPFGTGGGPIDTLARVYADKLSARWGQPVIVDAKPGASGIIAADFVAKAPADGYTVMMTLPLTHVNVPILQKTPYDPAKDFTPLSMVATGGPMIVARANAPFSNLKEFVEFAKKSAKPLNYGTWGSGSSAHLFGELLQRQSGAKTDPCALQVRSRGAQRPVWRPAGLCLGQPVYSARPGAGRQDEGAGHCRHAARVHHAQRAHLCRAGLPGL